MYSFCVLIVVFLFLTDSNYAQHTGSIETEQQILNTLMKNYDKRVRPPAANSTDGAVRVRVNMLIRMLSKIDVVNMEYAIQITFREQWIDPRLAFANKTSNPPDFLTVPHIKNDVWIPDTFFPTEKAAHRHLIDMENMFLRIYKDGTILYSSRISLTASCPMRLQLYPLDYQMCNFDMVSYAHTMKDIIYEWDPITPVQLKKGVGSDLPNFVLIDTRVNADCTSHTNTGSYACLRMEMILKRQFSYYLVQLYAPTTMIVIVSWVSFWIDLHSTAGRVALGVTTLLTMTTMQSAINAKLPPVSYVKVVDVWLGACQTFVFGALLEYAFVSYQDSARQNDRSREKAARKAQKRREKLEMVDAEIYQPPCTCHTFQARETFRDRLRRYFTKPDYLPAKIDFYARFMAPIAFLTFNVIYWVSCLSMSSDANPLKVT